MNNFHLEGTIVFIPPFNKKNTENNRKRINIMRKSSAQTSDVSQH